ncbi:hypothetical protein HQ590_07335 [bacterium]|nr:hypothetical protein [bacterium]
MAPSDASEALEAVRRLADEYRPQCLWFLPADYQPRTVAEALMLLDHIERRGDCRAFREAARLRQWLSQNSSAASAV